MPFPHGIHPFWFWNDRLEAEEIRRQVAEMAAQGARGFFIHPRQGLSQPYLSEAFFEMVDVALDAAGQHGMTVQLYDEFPYPSGAAGGETTLGAPEFLATRLRQVKHRAAGGPVRWELPPGRVLNCAAYPVRDGRTDWSAPRDLRPAVGMVLVENTFRESGLTPYNRKRFLACRPTPVLETNLPAGTWQVYASVQAVVEGHKYWHNFPDVLNPAAVARFLQLTHERYRARYAAHFGARIPAIYTDETSPGWSARIPEAFRAEYGYHLLPLLPALQEEDHPEHPRVKADLERLRYRLFCEAFEEQVGSWCRRNGLLYVAEKHSARMAQLRYQDVPGCDAGHQKAGAKPRWLSSSIRHNPRVAASAAYFYGKPGCLCECGHSLGWGATIQDAKLIADGLLLLGIDTLVPHGFFYSTHGLRKHDAPPSFFFQMPYWPLWGRLARRVERVLAAFADTHLDADIFVVEPTPGLPTTEMGETYESLQEALMDAQLDFLMVDTDVLEATEIAEGRARSRDVAARVVIVPPMRVVEPALAAWLERFAASGGIVERVAEPFDPAAFVSRLQSDSPSRLRLTPQKGETAARVWVASRVANSNSDKRSLWFVLNTTHEAKSLRCDAGIPLCEAPLDEVLAPRLALRDGEYRLSLAPFESVLLEADGGAGAVSPAPPTIGVAADGPARVRLHNSNLVRLGDWELTLDGQTARVPPMPLVNQLAVGRFRFAPDFALGFGVSPQIRLPEMKLQYACSFGHEFEGSVALAMEPGSIVGSVWRWRLNDGEWRDAGALQPVSQPVRGSLGLDVTGALRKGLNRLEVEAVADRPDAGLMNPLYLVGDFAVAFRLAEAGAQGMGVPTGAQPAATIPWLVPPRPDGGWFERYAANGLPFYAGVVEYESEFALPALPSSETLDVALRYSRPFQEATEVSFNDGPWRPVLWEPRHVAAPRTELRVGTNRLRTRVYTALLRSFEGQWFDPVRHESRGVEDDPEP